MVPLLFVLHPQLQSAWKAAFKAHDAQGGSGGATAESCRGAKL